MAQQSHQLFELFKADHRQVEKLIKQISSQSQHQHQEQFTTLRTLLSAHMQVEEKFFYPKLQPIKDMKALVEDALDEHQEARDYLGQLQKMSMDAEEWQETFAKMHEGLSHHIEDEEQEIFPKCTEFLKDQDLADIARKCVQEKEKILSRPEPAKAKKSPRKEAHI